MVRKIYGKQPGDPVEDLNMNLAIWRTCMNTTLRAAVHFGKDNDTNLRFAKNYLWSTTGQLFRETEKLISGQTETTSISLFNFQDLRSVSTCLFALSSLSICHSLPKSLLRLCALLGKMGPDLVKSWKNQIQWYSENDYFSELNRIDGQPMVFEWNIFLGFTIVGILNEIQQMMEIYSVS